MSKTDSSTNSHVFTVKNILTPRPKLRTTADILAVPVTRHTVVEKLAQRLTKYDGNRAAFFLKREVSKLVARRIKCGIPQHIVTSDAEALERAVWIRMQHLHHKEGGAA